MFCEDELVLLNPFLPCGSVDTMRLVLGVVALLATLQCCCSGADAEGSTLVDAAIKKAVQESVGVPVSEFWKDFYGAVVRQKGARAARRLRYLVRRALREAPSAT